MALLSLERTVINHFIKETGPGLIALDIWDVIDPKITNCLRKAPINDQTRSIEFVRFRIGNVSKTVVGVIPRAGLTNFSNRSSVDLMKVATKLGSAKTNAVLIAKLLLTLKAWPGAYTDDFFRYESQPELPSLSDHWNLCILSVRISSLSSERALTWELLGIIQACISGFTGYAGHSLLGKIPLYLCIWWVCRDAPVATHG